MDSDAVACGRIACRALLASGLVGKLPHAAPIFTDDSPLPLQASRRIVATVAGSVIAFMDFNEDYIYYLFVDPQWQNLGVGSELLRLVETLGNRRVTIRLLEDNEYALGWYLRRGYHIGSSEYDGHWHGGPVHWLVLNKLCAGEPYGPKF